MFFVIDFETSALDPWNGQPLTLGIVPVTMFGEILPIDFYCEWDVEDMPQWEFPANLTDTESWWNEKRKVDDPAFAAAWLRANPVYSNQQILDDIDEFVHATEPDKNQRFMCANPAAFDVMWMNYIYSLEGRLHPFHYRNLCLRSMRFGIEYGGNPEFGNARDEHELDGYIPHHALWDAKMEAIDLVKLMGAASHQNNQATIYGARPSFSEPIRVQSDFAD
jgi:hypothetical protein